MPGKSIIFNCEIITPMFAGAALPGDCELRPSAIKGALRFWWRAMNGRMPLNDIKDSDEKIIKKGLRTHEADIFGGSDENVGRSKVEIEVKSLSLDGIQFNLESIPYSDEKKRLSGSLITREIDLMGYFAYGMNEANKRVRKYFAPGQQFTVKMTFRNLEQAKIQEIIEAFYLISYVGGLGSKSRNGFGRFKVIGRNDAASNPDWLQLLRTLTKGSETSFTSFSNQIAIWQTTITAKETRTWKSEYKKIASAFKYAKSCVDSERSYGTRQYITLPMKGCNLLSRHSKTHFLTLIEESDGIRGYIIHFPYLFLLDNNLGIGAIDVSKHQTNYMNRVKDTKNKNSFNSKLGEKLTRL